MLFSINKKRTSIQLMSSLSHRTSAQSCTDLSIEERKDAVTAIIVTLLPRLRHLCLHMCFADTAQKAKQQTYYLDKVFQDAVSKQAISQASSNSSLQQLQVLEIRPATTAVESRLHYDISQVCSLRSIEKLVLKDPELQGDDIIFTSAIKNIDLNVRFLAYNRYAMKVFTKRFTALESFSFRLSSAFGGIHRNMNTILKPLSSAQSTLKHLRLTIPIDWSRGGVPHSHVETLSGFRCLESIDVPAFDLWHGCSPLARQTITSFTGFLPSSIRKMTLGQGSESTLHYAIELLKVKRERFPKLEFLRVKMRNRLAGWENAATRNRNAALLEAAGVKYGVKVLLENHRRSF